jgi:hypothetical protein
MGEQARQGHAPGSSCRPAIREMGAVSRPKWDKPAAVHRGLKLAFTQRTRSVLTNQPSDTHLSSNRPIHRL